MKTNNYFFKGLLMSLMLIVSAGANAEDFEVDGIYYSFNDDGSTVSVTYKGPESWEYDEYSGDVVIPEYVTYEGTAYCVTGIDKAFNSCEDLTSVTIPKTIVFMSKYAFYGAKGLTAVYISDLAAWTQIEFEDCAFDSNPLYYAHNLYLNGGLVTELIIPDGVTKISGMAFAGCSALTSIVIPNSVTSIGENAFLNCSGVTNITIPESVTTIENYAFQNCSELEAIVIPSAVEHIGGVAFYRCNKLSSFIIDDNNPYFSLVGNGLYNKDKTEFICFIGETTDYSILESVTKIGDYAFYRCPENTITLPAEVQTIGNYAFGNCGNLTSITIPNGVTSIGDYAFYGCTSLTSVVIPNGVTSIGDYAFRNCRGLTSFTLPNSIQSINEGVFEDCSKLASINIPESVTFIGENAFSGCSSLKEVHINDIKSWCEIDFQGANSYPLSRSGSLYLNGKLLTDVVIPDGTTSIGNNTFRNCSDLVSVTIPNSVTSIGDYAFYYASGLESVTIPEGVTSIGDYAFYYASGLESVTIPASVTSIGISAFAGCYKLSSLIVNGGNAVYDSRNNCNAIIESESNTLMIGCKNTIVPNDIVSIGDYAFCSCDLTEVIIPNSVTSIGISAFYNCDLTEIIIPNSVQSIGGSAFAYCRDLSSIYCVASTPCVLEHSLFYYYEDDKYSSVTLYVPTGSLDAYRNAEIWKNFTNIVEFDPEIVGIENVKTDDFADNIKAENGIIVIENTVGSAIVYDMSGRMVEKVELNGGRTEITMPNKGVYVVKIGNKAVKVSL